MGEHKIIPKPFSEKLQKWAGFRNVLVHNYVRLDLDKVYDTLQKDLGDIGKFAKVFAKFL